MKTKKILSALMLILMALFVMQCEKGSKRPPGSGEGDPDSDRKPWAGPGGEENPHTNSSPGISKGGNYGDLLELLRSPDGVPEMTQIEVEEELIWVVQPVDTDGDIIPYNEEGELSLPELALPVDFGRLNIVRSPDGVLEQAFNEAMKVLQAEDENEVSIVEEIRLDFSNRLMVTYLDLSTEDDLEDVIVKTIDSPRENMAIYKEIMQNLFEVGGRLAFLDDPPYNLDPLEVAAGCFAAGSDKTGTVNVDEAVYINTFLECVGPANVITNINEIGPDNSPRQYFNFSTCCDGEMFRYNRSDEHGAKQIIMSGNPPTSLLAVMENQGRFTQVWGPLSTWVAGEDYVMEDGEMYVIKARGFALAIDDAVQILEFMHENLDPIIPVYD